MGQNGSGHAGVANNLQISVAKHNACLFLTCGKDPPWVNGGGRSSLCCPEGDGLYHLDHHHSQQGDRKVMNGLNFIGFCDTSTHISLAKASHVGMVNLKTVGKYNRPQRRETGDIGEEL